MADKLIYVGLEMCAWNEFMSRAKAVFSKKDCYTWSCIHRIEEQLNEA
jgi:hypothetical protein